VAAWTRLLRPAPKRMNVLTAAATIISQQPAQDSTGLRSRLLPDEQEWQREAWGFYDSLGMFRNAVTWKSDMLSRVRLRAAKKEPDNDEPTILDKGRAAEIVAEISAGDQSQILAGLAVYLSVPGEGYLIGETQPNGKNKWFARSTEEVRYRPTANSRKTLSGNPTVSPYEIVDERSAGNTIRWRALNVNAMVVRVWRPHRRYYHVADSNSRPARNTMRELELVNRHIAAQYISRLASDGIVIFPSEVQFPVRPEFADAADPFMREWIETAAEAIATPGSAAAAVPMPMRMPGEQVKNVQYIDFTAKHDLKIIEKRQDAGRQLAVDLDIPPEALLGLADANHWTGWLIEEQGFKIYLAPDCELMCAALTEGMLLPRLEAEGEDTEDIVVWYDASEITQRPDKSENTKDAYDRGEASGKALRRELGLDEDDAPTPEELTQMILYVLAKNPVTAFAALKELTGVDVEPPAPAVVQSPVEVPTDAPSASGESGQQGPPEQKSGPPTEKPATASALLDSQLIRQAGLQHAVRVSPLNGVTLLHPLECAEHLMSCPVTHATWGDAIKHLPGSPGVYACQLSKIGKPMVGRRLLDADVDTMLPTLDVLLGAGEG
jgi:hypothetical protein